jgi:hypothetical protein
LAWTFGALCSGRTDWVLGGRVMIDDQSIGTSGWPLSCARVSVSSLFLSLSLSPLSSLLFLLLGPGTGLTWPSCPNSCVKLSPVSLSSLSDTPSLFLSLVSLGLSPSLSFSLLSLSSSSLSLSLPPSLSPPQPLSASSLSLPLCFTSRSLYKLSFRKTATQPAASNPSQAVPLHW